MIYGNKAIVQCREISYQDILYEINNFNNFLSLEVLDESSIKDKVVEKLKKLKDFILSIPAKIRKLTMKVIGFIKSKINKNKSKEKEVINKAKKNTSGSIPNFEGFIDYAHAIQVTDINHRHLCDQIVEFYSDTYFQKSENILNIENEQVVISKITNIIKSGIKTSDPKIGLNISSANNVAEICDLIDDWKEKVTSTKKSLSYSDAISTYETCDINAVSEYVATIDKSADAVNGYLRKMLKVVDEIAKDYKPLDEDDDDMHNMKIAVGNCYINLYNSMAETINFFVKLHTTLADMVSKSVVVYSNLFEYIEKNTTDVD